MKLFRTKIHFFVMVVFSLGIMTVLNVETVKADVPKKDNKNIVLRSVEFKTNKVIKVPVKEKVVNSGTVSRGGSYSSSKGSRIVSYAKQYLGKPYIWGASGPRAFDCSGFTMYVYKAFGVSLPHRSTIQATKGTKVSRSYLQPGDLVFFNTVGSRISHVGIYIGGGRFIHASSGSHKVTISSLSENYYNSRYVTGRRLLH